VAGGAGEDLGGEGVILPLVFGEELDAFATFDGGE
jgi:hypothetical protein